MAFGQSSGPSASHRQIARLVELLEEAGHTDFRDARGPMGFTQRQAGGKFTVDEAEGFIHQLEEQQLEEQQLEEEQLEQEQAGAQPPKPAKNQALDTFSDQELAAELQSRGWVVMEP